MPATSKKATTSAESDFRLRFGSIAEIRHKQMAAEIVDKHGGPAAVKSATASVMLKGKAVKALRDKLLKLRLSNKKSATD